MLRQRWQFNSRRNELSECRNLTLLLKLERGSNLVQQELSSQLLDQNDSINDVIITIQIIIKIYQNSLALVALQ